MACISPCDLLTVNFILVIFNSTGIQMWNLSKQVQMSLRAFLLVAAKIWTFMCYVVRKQYRAVSINKNFTLNVQIRAEGRTLAQGGPQT